MRGPNGTSHAEWTQHLLDEQFEAFKADIRRLVEHARDEQPPRWRRFVYRAGELVRAYPFAAAGAAFALGYLTMRLVRR